MNLPMLLCPKVNTEYLMAESPIGKALEKFRASGYNALPVLWEDGRYCGAVSSRDFLTYIMENGTAANEKGVQELLRMCDHFGLEVVRAGQRPDPRIWRAASSRNSPFLTSWKFVNSTPSSSTVLESGGMEPGVVPPISAWWPRDPT